MAKITQAGQGISAPKAGPRSLFLAFGLRRTFWLSGTDPEPLDDDVKVKLD